MLLQLSHRFEAPRGVVIDALSSCEYAAQLAAEHSFFAQVDVLSRVEQGDVVARTVRYRARPFIARLGVFSLPPEWFVWVERSVFDRRAGLLQFENVPESTRVRAKVINRGTMSFHAQRGADGSWLTTRDADFEIDLRVAPLYRPLAELALGMMRSQLTRSLDEEAGLLTAWLRRSSQHGAVAA